MAINHEDSTFVCGVNASTESMASGSNPHCRLYSVKDDQVTLVRKAQTIAPLSMEIYQNVTALSRDRTLIAVGSTENEVAILSYPSLTAASEPFRIPAGTLYSVDFSDSNLLITTDTTLYFIALPLNLVNVITRGGKEGAGHIQLPTLEISKQIALPSLAVLGGSSDGSVRTFRAGRFNPKNPKSLYTVINSAPPSGAGRGRKPKVERKSYIVRWELGVSVIGATDVKAAVGAVVSAADEEWHVRKVQHIGKRAVTVFDVSENGKLAAYGASDSSVGIVDARTLAPLLTILKSHDFPPTALQFNPSSSLLVSGSADASVRVFVVPEAFTSSSTFLIMVMLALLVMVAAVLAQRVL